MFARLHQYGPLLTTHDAVKLIAIVLMVIDHIGYFFAPDELWWRAIGRMCFPLFFFLAGYAKPSRMRKDIIILAVVMVLVDMLTFNALFPLNILVALLICRAALNWWESRDYQGKRLEELFFLLLLWVFPALILFEYGTLALMYTLCGYLLRRKVESAVITKAFVYTLICYVAIQAYGFGFSAVQVLVMAAGCALELALLRHYAVRPVAVPAPRPVISLLLLLARYSLYVYFIHYTVFLLVEWQMHPELHEAFVWVE